MNRPEPCCEPDCTEEVVAFYPAFDRTVEPRPYCEKHLAQARRNLILEGPHFINMAKKKKDLICV